MLVVETTSNQDLVPVPSQVENYKLMERNFGIKMHTPQRFSESDSESQQYVPYQLHQQQQQQRQTRNRFNSINENNATNVIDFASSLSTSPTLKFQLGGISPSGGIGSGGSSNKFLLHNLGDPVLIDDLEEETILDVS
jgi:hypothetical protein